MPRAAVKVTFGRRSAPARSPRGKPILGRRIEHGPKRPALCLRSSGEDDQCRPWKEFEFCAAMDRLQGTRRFSMARTVGMAASAESSCLSAAAIDVGARAAGDMSALMVTRAAGRSFHFSRRAIHARRVRGPRDAFFKGEACGESGPCTISSASPTPFGESSAGRGGRATAPKHNASLRRASSSINLPKIRCRSLRRKVTEKTSRFCTGLQFPNASSAKSA